MKKLFLLSFVLALAIGVNAQFGVRAGANFAKSTSDMSGYDNNMVRLPGINAGLIYEKDIIPIPMPLLDIAIRVEADYSQKGEKYKVHKDTSMISQYEYLEIPVSLKLKIGPAYIFTGPHIAYAISGNYKSKNWVGSGEETVAVDWDKTDMKRLDYGIQGGAGITLLNIVPMIQPFIEARYILGLANISGVDTYSIQNNSITISVGILLGRK